MRTYCKAQGTPFSALGWPVGRSPEERGMRVHVERIHFTTQQKPANTVKQLCSSENVKKEKIAFHVLWKLSQKSGFDFTAVRWISQCFPGLEYHKERTGRAVTKMKNLTPKEEGELPRVTQQLRGKVRFWVPTAWFGRWPTSLGEGHHGPRGQPWSPTKGSHSQSPAGTESPAGNKVPYVGLPSVLGRHGCSEEQEGLWPWTYKSQTIYGEGQSLRALVLNS